MKNIVLLSGGHQSAIVAIEVYRKFGNKNLILLNHDINPEYEHQDIKRFKREISEHTGVEITFVNFQNEANSQNIPNQLELSVAKKTFVFNNKYKNQICTYYLKTNPFDEWLKRNYQKEDIIYYGFSKDEIHRKLRREKILGEKGILSSYPLIDWKVSIKSTQEIGINPPCVYENFKHANCIGCLKAGMQHWYCVFCLRPDIFSKAKVAEEYIGQSIHPEGYLKEFEEKFEAMQFAGITPSEHIASQKFWAIVKKQVPGIHFQISFNLLDMPCECVV